MGLRVRILGAAAGGGLPQWNCGCGNCDLARAGEIPAQTQSSIAVSADGAHWAVVNASPDIRQQLAATPALHPTEPRRLPLDAVLLTNGDIDHVAGLLTLRERQGFTLFATGEILDVIAGNPIFGALAPDVVTRTAVSLDAPFELLPGLEATLYAVPGKVPLYMEGTDVRTDLEGEQTVGVRLRANGRTVHYVPGCAAIGSDLRARLSGAAAVLFDGTLWADDEMVRAGLSHKTGTRMGHVSISGPNGSMTGLAQVEIGRRVYVHLNNTNPVLRPGSAERAAVEAGGWTVAQDGMEIET
jgi:pyrroloquinoline quinone biosynthesis protein B